MNKFLVVSLFAILSFSAIFAQKVEEERMRQIYEESLTPYKFGLVVAPETNKEKFDCPMVYREGSKWYMTFVCYNGKEGKDGRGYETWLSESDDLLHWKTLGRILEFPRAAELQGQGSGNRWDKNQRGGFPALIDNEWGGSYRMETFKGRHWMTYIGGEGTGYEGVNAPLNIGLASTKGDITKAFPWECQDKPIIAYNDKEAQWWENLIEYKSTVYKVDKKYFGYPFVMFYNAGGKDENHPKAERIGIALSKDMVNWKRYEGNPVFYHEVDGMITGDAQIVKMGDVFVMYYFSAYNPARRYNAYNTFAASRDLVHWTEWEGEDLIFPSKPYDEMFAHKSYVLKHDGVVYHFYCAVNNAGQRGIALATSRRLGQSEVHFPTPDPTGHRYVQTLNEGWSVQLPAALLSQGSKVNDQGAGSKEQGAGKNGSSSSNGNTNRQKVNGQIVKCDVPFNLDDYYGAVQKEHGNLHGEAVCTKSFFLEDKGDKEYFIRFEGVGTYGEIEINGNPLGRYDIGRTCLTLDVTKYIRRGAENTLVVKVSHPEGITDMPWVCGGCSSEWGFSEGSQPFGIFRPVTLEATDKIRIEPFGVHVWSNKECDSVFVDTEVKNYSDETATFLLVTRLRDANGKQVLRLNEKVTLNGGETKVIRQQELVGKVNLWSLSNPYLYSISSLVKRDDKTVESTETPFGFRSIRWDRENSPGFYLNGERTFIDGTCEYEHIFGQSHAFSNEQIRTRVNMVKSAGFNAFRDAHQPHNLYYKELLDKDGLLWWPQFSAHIWFDTPQFRESFKRHLRQWVKERRNSPSLILWGLQNESTLPKDFAEECTQIIREMDPTCGSQRLVTTCNGGEGTDWNVVQNWSGTYGGDIDNYANELKQKDQLLNGEYGAWRTLGNHTGDGYTEEKFVEILSKKQSLAQSVRDSVCGQFQWLLCSHDNPGRRQPDEALRRIDKVGPFNYKGLFTIWDQPTAAAELLMGQGSMVKGQWSKVKEQVAGKVKEQGDALTFYSHSWGDRFEGVSSYQCSQTYNPELPLEAVFQTSRFGRHELYYHFDAAPGDYQIELYFVEPWFKETGPLAETDYEGWRLFDVGINDSTVIRDLDIWSQVGYGKVYKRVIDYHCTSDEIKIHFPKVKSGQAMIAAIAIKQGGECLCRVNCGGDDYVDPEGNLWLQDHCQGAAELQVASSKEQVAGKNGSSSSNGNTNRQIVNCKIVQSKTMWGDFEEDILVKTPDSLLPPTTSRAIEAKPVINNQYKKAKNSKSSTLSYTFTVGVAKVYSLRFKYWNGNQARKLRVKLTDQNGVVYKNDDITFLQTQQKASKRKMTSITTGDFVNAGTYTVTVTGEGLEDMVFDNLVVE